MPLLKSIIANKGLPLKSSRPQLHVKHSNFDQCRGSIGISVQFNYFLSLEHSASSSLSITVRLQLRGYAPSGGCMENQFSDGEGLILADKPKSYRIVPTIGLS